MPTSNNVGKVIQVMGPAVDLQFSEGQLPAIYNAVRVVSEGFDIPHPLDVILEVQLSPPYSSRTSSLRRHTSRSVAQFKSVLCS